MFLANAVSENISIGDAAILAILGYAVVFFGLILLMIVVIALGKAFSMKKEKPAEKPVAPVAAAPVVAAPAPIPVSQLPVNAQDAAPGSAGQLKLHDVQPKTAAMLMAIVADKLGKPLNELRFISIKEVRHD